MSFFAYALAQRSYLLEKIAEHALLTGVATLAAILIGVPVGILIARRPSLRGVALGAAGIMQTIPSLAMLALLMSLMRTMGWPPAVTALILYALLPIIVNTLTGLRGVDPDILEAADGLGMTASQKLWMVELPLAAPVVIAGIRTAAVMTVGIATLSTFIGAGGLGELIWRGIQTPQNPRPLLLGVLTASLMALLLGGMIGIMERTLKRRLRQA